MYKNKLIHKNKKYQKKNYKKYYNVGKIYSSYNRRNNQINQYVPRNLFADSTITRLKTCAQYTMSWTAGAYGTNNYFRINQLSHFSGMNSEMPQNYVSLCSFYSNYVIYGAQFYISITATVNLPIRITLLDQPNSTAITGQNVIAENPGAYSKLLSPANSGGATTITFSKYSSMAKIDGVDKKRIDDDFYNYHAAVGNTGTVTTAPGNLDYCFLYAHSYLNDTTYPVTLYFTITSYTDIKFYNRRQNTSDT